MAMVGLSAQPLQKRKGNWSETSSAAGLGCELRDAFALGRTNQRALWGLSGSERESCRGLDGKAVWGLVFGVTIVVNSNQALSIYHERQEGRVVDDGGPIR